MAKQLNKYAKAAKALDIVDEALGKALKTIDAEAMRIIPIKEMQDHMMEIYRGVRAEKLGEEGAEG
jgi:hypothetical protein